VKLFGRGKYSLWLFLLQVIDGWETFTVFDDNNIKAKVQQPSEISSAGAKTGRCCITAFIVFWNLG
jgi:hypothetical protein